MALAMTPVAAMQDDIMEIDIDMDVDDIPATADDEILLEEGEQPEDVAGNDGNAGLIPAIYLEDPAQEPEWNKIYLKGVDDLSTDHVKTFATDSYPEAEPHVQWVDDTSANLVYKDKSTAKAAFIELSQTPTSVEDITNDPFTMRQAKPLVSHPASILTLRVAQVGDRKRRNAKDASRYYLLHPEADPRERMRKEFAAGRPRSENGDYKRRRFDDREHRRRRDQDYNGNDPTNDFEASMYDDAPSSKTKSQARGRDLFSRIGDRPRRRSASPTANGDALSVSDSEDEQDTRKRRGGYRDRKSPPRRNNTGKELFGDASESNGGMRSDHVDHLSRKKSGLNRADSVELRQQTNLAAARRFKADIAASSLSQSPARNHRRSRAIDSRVEEDLAERFGRKSISLDSTKSVTQATHNSGKELFSDDSRTINGNGGLNIKGSAAQGMSIKGRADVKELFPDRFSSNPNAGKELIDRMDAPVGRGRGPRKRAGDLFD